MDNNFENNTNTEGNTPDPTILETEQPVYTDPNADVKEEGQSTDGSSEQNNYYQGYVTPNQPYNGEEGYDTAPMSTGDWLLVILVTLIPCAGIILYFVWAFSKTGNINRRNYCRAALIYQGAGLVIGILLAIIFGGIIMSALGYYMY